MKEDQSERSLLERDESLALAMWAHHLESAIAQMVAARSELTAVASAPSTLKPIALRLLRSTASLQMEAHSILLSARAMNVLRSSSTPESEESSTEMNTEMLKDENS